MYTHKRHIPVNRSDGGVDGVGCLDPDVTERIVRHVLVRWPGLLQGAARRRTGGLSEKAESKGEPADNSQP